jgi:hypothetical protein
MDEEMEALSLAEIDEWLDHIIMIIEWEEMCQDYGGES